MDTEDFDDKERVLARLQQKEPPENAEHPQGSIGQKLNESAVKQTVSNQARDLTSSILEWLSNATNESLGACLAGLGAITYLVLGRVGLVIIGAVGGVVLHATWEETAQNHADDEAEKSDVRRKREKGLDVVKRVLDWRERAHDDKEKFQDEVKELDFSGYQPETRIALESLVDTIIRDYVK